MEGEYQTGNLAWLSWKENEEEKRGGEEEGLEAEAGVKAEQEAQEKEKISDLIMQVMMKVS